MLLKVCANGSRKILEHPMLSANPEVIAAECAKAVEAGAGAVHVHPKNEYGEDSLVASDVDRWVRVLRQHCPDTPVGVTTGEWAMLNVAARLREVDKWQELPDFVSVNWHEDGADKVATKLLDRGVGVEAGIWHRAGLRAWSASSVRSRCLRVLIEVQDVAPGEAHKSGRMLVKGVSDLEPKLPALLHGEERSTWAAIELAGHLGLDTRAGLEDCLTLPDGSVAAGNDAMVHAALHVVSNFREAT